MPQAKAGWLIKQGSFTFFVYRRIVNMEGILDLKSPKVRVDEPSELTKKARSSHQHLPLRLAPVIAHLLSLG
jgi:hypothetical protein